MSDRDPMRLVFACAAVALLGCKASPPAVADAAPPAIVEAGAPSAARADAAAAPPIASSSASGRSRLPCRAIATTGRVTLGDAGAIATGGELDPAAWLELGDGARLTAKDPRSGRETALVGAGRARACVGADEEMWLARGAIESSPRSAMLPGAEEWVVTPVGAFRFAAAAVTIAIDPKSKEGRATVTGGSLFAWSAPHVTLEPAPARSDASDDAWIRLDAGARLVLRERSPEPAMTHDTAIACRDAADRAKTLAARLLSPEGRVRFVELATQQAEARLVARAACTVAALRVALLPVGPSTADLDATVRAADAAWRGLPEAGPR